MHPMTAATASLQAIGPMLVLAAGLGWGNCQALEQSAALSVQVTLNPQSSCTTSLFGYSVGVALSTCQASSYQLSAIRPSWEQTTMSGAPQLQVVQTGLEMGLLGSSLKHWAIVQADRAWKTNQVSQDIAYYELRVDY